MGRMGVSGVLGWGGGWFRRERKGGGECVGWSGEGGLVRWTEWVK